LFGDPAGCTIAICLDDRGSSRTLLVMATFVCPACWKVTEMPDDMAGGRARCPECHATGPVAPKAGPTVAVVSSPKQESIPGPAPKSPTPPLVRERPAAQKAPAIPRPPMATRRIVLVVIWSACFLWTFGVMLGTGMVGGENFGVRACAWILGGYVLARAVDAIVRAKDRD
jgi:hypothetical protein